MTEKTKVQGNEKEGKGPKFTLDIEGQLIPWDEPTITTEKIAELGGWDPSQGVLLIDQDNVERQLQPGEVVELKPGMGFSKKVRFKRG
ncbi:MAG: multiubiquitin domain-containing protein [bacterium]|nr:multiubiquitin domain-containing protein [bacterium]